MKKEVSNKLKVINFVCAIFVLLAHFGSKKGYNINYLTNNENFFDIYVEFTQLLCKFAMTTFFVISAFLFYYNIKDSKGAFLKIKKRLKTLLIPYAIFTIMIWFIRFFIYKDSNAYISSPASFFKIIFFLPIDGPLWYLLALMILMIPSPLIVKLKNKKIMPFFLFTFSLVLTNNFNKIIFDKFDMNRWWWYQNMFTYLAAYLTGVYLSLNFPETIAFEKYDNKKSIVIGILLFIISLIILKTSLINRLLA